MAVPILAQTILYLDSTVGQEWECVGLYCLSDPTISCL
jgi:hypothetical protein